MFPETPENIADQKVKVVKRCIKESLKDPEFIQFVRNAFGGTKTRDIIRVLWNYQNKFLFIQEPGANDYCKHAIEFAKEGKGDCEDFTVFNSSVLTLFGITHRIRVMDTRGEGYYTHILLYVLDPIYRRWSPFDGTYRIRGLGGEPIHKKTRMYII